MRALPIAIAASDAQIGRCFDCMRVLRPHLTRSEFIPRIQSMREQGYELAFVDHAGVVVGVAGYRIEDKLHTGRALYVDDLSVLADERSRGHGGALLGWLEAQARDRGCVVIHLDSGAQRHRAHRFYFRHGFHISSYHFFKEL